MSRQLEIAREARQSARAAIRGGFWRLGSTARLLDADGIVDAAEPLASDEEEVEELLGSPLTPEERLLWVGAWRATLRDAAPKGRRG